MPHKHSNLTKKKGVVGVYTDKDGDTVVQFDEDVDDTMMAELSPDGKYEKVPGGMVAQKRTDKFRPIKVGISHSALDVTAGTTGVLVTRNGSGPFVDTNYHVAVGPTAVEDEKIVQPGTYDDGDMDDVYGTLEWYVEMSEDTNLLGRVFEFILNIRRLGTEKSKYSVDRNAVMRHDAALVKPDFAEFDLSIEGVDKYPTKIESAPIGETCMKSGRTTGVTKMEKVSEDWTGMVRYPWGPVQFVDQHLYKGIDGPGSKGGDSGSTILWDDWDKVDGRLFAGNEKANTTIGNPYKHFSEEYNVELYTGG